MRRRFILAGLALTAIASAPLAKSLSPTIAPQSGQALKQVLGPTGPSGWMLVDLDSGAVIDAHDIDRPFAPASVAKLPTAAFALDALGPGFSFETRVLGTGRLAGGQLSGDLILQGGGDPELDTDALAALVRQVQAAGVRRVAGRFLVDGAALPEVSEIEPEQGDAASYNPSLSGLNLNFNRVHVKWDARGNRRHLSVEAAAEQLSPQVKGVQISLNDTPGAPLFSHSLGRGTEHWQMARRAFRGRGARWLPVKRPAAYAGEVFHILARQQGLDIGLPGMAAAPGEARVLARMQGRPLGAVVRDMLRFSTNITAEAVGTAASRSAGRQVASLPASANIMNAWAAAVGGFQAGDPGFRLANHSGLSLDSRLSPRRMTDLLRGLARQGRGSTHPSLPGRIAGYLRDYEVADDSVPLDYDRLHVVAKTGTISFVRGLAGYIATPKGRRLAFAIFSNDLDRRTGGSEKVNRGWMADAKRFERALIRNWVLRVDGA